MEKGNYAGSLSFFLRERQKPSVSAPRGGPKAPGPLESGWEALAPQTPEMQVSEAIGLRAPCIRIDQKLARGALCFAGRAPG